MANPMFEQKKDWARGKNLEPVPARPSWVQSLWTSTPERLAPPVGLTSLLSSAAYSKPGQFVPPAVVSNRPEGAGLIGDYLRDEIAFGTAVRGLLSGPR